MTSLDILKNETNVFYTTCLNIFLVHLSEKIEQFSTVQKHLSLSRMDTIKDMHFTLYVYICLVHFDRKTRRISSLQRYYLSILWFQTYIPIKRFEHKV